MSTILTMPNDVLIPELGRMLNEGKQVMFRVKGNSMLPFIHGDRDSVLIAPCSDMDLQCGKVILAKTTRGNFVLHRIISPGIDEQGILTLMGDGNLVGTEQCHASDVLGIALKVIYTDGHERILYTRTDKLLVSLWNLLKPIRRYLLAIYRRIS